MKTTILECPDERNRHGPLRKVQSSLKGSLILRHPYVAGMAAIEVKLFRSLPQSVEGEARARAAYCAGLPRVCHHLPAAVRQNEGSA